MSMNGSAAVLTEAKKNAEKRRHVADLPFLQLHRTHRLHTHELN